MLCDKATMVFAFIHRHCQGQVSAFQGRRLKLLLSFLVEMSCVQLLKMRDKAADVKSRSLLDLKLSLPPLLLPLSRFHQLQERMPRLLAKPPRSSATCCRLEKDGTYQEQRFFD